MNCRMAFMKNLKSIICIVVIELTLMIQLVNPIKVHADNFCLSCDCGNGSYVRSLPNGDVVTLFCPVSGTAHIHRMDNSTLPARLPTGYTYLSAFTVEIFYQGAPFPFIREGGFIKASFVAQPLQPGNTYSVLYWDDWKIENGKWVEHPEDGSWIPLKAFFFDKNLLPRSFNLFPGVLDDARKIVSGVNPITRNGSSWVEVSTNFLGVFVLAKY